MKRITFVIVAVSILIFAMQEKAQAQFTPTSTNVEDLMTVMRTNPYQLNLAPEILPQEIIKAIMECRLSDAEKAYDAYKLKAKFTSEKEPVVLDLLCGFLLDKARIQSTCWQQNKMVVEETIDTVMRIDTIREMIQFMQEDSLLGYKDTIRIDTNFVEVINRKADALSENEVTLIQKINLRTENARSKMLSIFPVETEEQAWFMLNLLGMDILSSRNVLDVVLKAATESKTRKGIWNAILAVHYDRYVDCANARAHKQAAIEANYDNKEINLNSRLRCTD